MEGTPLPTGTPTPTPEPGNIGDINDDGEVNIIDALLIAQYYVGLEPSPFNTDAVDALLVAQDYVGLNPVAFTNPQMADVNCNSTIDILDALLIAKYYVGIIPEFDCPVSTQYIELGVFTWAVIVDLDSESVTQPQAQELVDQASFILMEMSGFTYSNGRFPSEQQSWYSK